MDQWLYVTSSAFLSRENMYLSFNLMNISQTTIVHVTIIAQGFWTAFTSFYIKKKTIKSILKFYNSLITSMPIIPKFAVYIF